MEGRTRRSSSQFLIDHPLVIQVIRIYPYMIPFYILLRVHTGCLNSRYFRNLDRAQNSTMQGESLFARAELHHQDELENPLRIEKI